MKYRPVAIIGVFGTLLAVCGLCVLTAYGMVAWISSRGANVRFFGSDYVSSQYTESFTLEAKPNLQIQSNAGDIVVTATDGDQIEVDLVKTSWGLYEAKAMTVIVEESDDMLRLISPDPTKFIRVGGGEDSIKYTVRVPAETAVDLDTSFGDISVTGTRGRVSLNTSSGDVNVSDVLAGEADISLEISFGDINIKDISGQDVRLETSNGEVSVTNLDANGEVVLKNSFGDISIEALTAASFFADTSNGWIKLVGGQVDGTIEARSSFGDLEVTDVAADGYTLTTSNGEIKLDGARGQIDLRNGFGGITVEDATDAILDIETSNGRVRFSGSLKADATHTIENSFGDITLTLPEDSAFDLVLETSFGEITSEIPVTLTGTLSETSWEAQLNSGGPRLQATTSGGDISLLALPSGQ